MTERLKVEWLVSGLMAQVLAVDVDAPRVVRLSQESAAQIEAVVQAAFLSPQWPDGEVNTVALVRDAMMCLRAASRRAVVSDDALTVVLTTVEAMAICMAMSMVAEVLEREPSA